MPASDGDLLRLDLRTGWLTDDRGRVVGARTTPPRPAPALVVAAADDGSGLVWAVSTAVPDAVIGPIVAVLADEPSAPAGDGWVPAGAERLRALVAPAGRVEVGRAYVLDRSPPSSSPPPGVVLRTSADPDAAAVETLVPEADRGLTAPWAIALVDGEVAAVCETARSAPTSAAAGVWTYEPHRRRGLATSVVAVWTALVADRTTFYGHLADNDGSRGVAHRVGFRPIGTWWWLRPDP